MKVVHVSCVAPPEGGGIGAVANQEVLGLRKLGVDAVLVAPSVILNAGEGSAKPFVRHAELVSASHEANGAEIPKQVRDDESIIRLPALRIGNVGRLIGLDKIIEEADVVHLHYPYYFTAGMIARWRRQNKIKHLAITLHHDATDKGWRWLAAELQRKLFQKQVLNAADLLLVSTLDYAHHSSFAPWVNDSRLHELPFGVDTELFKPSVIPAEAGIHPSSVILSEGEGSAEHTNFSEESAKLPVRHAELVSASHEANSAGIPKQVRDDSRTVGMVGVMDRAHPFKGVDVLLKAAAKLPSNVHVLLIGDGDRRGDYEKLAKELGLSERVHFVGHLDRNKLIEALQSMDVFAFPSTSNAEAFGLAMLEAMACGVPVVASDLPGVRAVAKDAGLIVPVNDPDALAEGLRRLLDDPATRHSFAVAARDKAVSYNWDNHARALLELYNQIPSTPLEKGRFANL
ncbi:MAG: glycosyltransferase family 4 protein [Patescibacteria group bacterium]|jgi:glycosyltransferase involved in cell wall biosynthesis